MNKKLLKALPFTAPKQTWIDLTKQAPNKQYYIAAQIKIIDHHKTLILDFYTAADLLTQQQPAYRVFLINKDYLTLTHQNNKNKWLTGSLYSILGWRWLNHCIIVDILSHDTICSFLRCSEAPLKAVENHQLMIKQSRLAAKHKKECQLIDKQMQSIQPLPKAFLKWIEEDTLPHYIYYVYKKRKTLDGYCTHCQKDVQVTDARHNKSGVCPICGKTIIFKAIGRAKNTVDTINAAYFQKTADGFVVRYFSIAKSYREHYHSPVLHLSEQFREFYFKNAAITSYSFGKYKNTSKRRWCPDNGKTLFYTMIYPNSLDTALNDTPWQYCSIEQYGQHCKVLSSVYRYLMVYRKSPVLEYLVKAKLFRLTEDHINNSTLFQERYKSPFRSLSAFLKVNQYYLKRMITTDAGYNECEIYQKLSTHQIMLNEAQLAFVFEHFKSNNVNSFIKLLHFTNKPIKTINYLQKTAQLEQRTVYQTASEWLDYLSMCSKMEYDLNQLNLLYPRNLKEEHDRVTQLFKLEESEAYDRKLGKMFPEVIAHFGYETEQFFIDAPKSQSDLINESAALGHCVKSYAPQIVERECTVIFLRRKSAPSKPYYTIELRENHIVQCRTKGNKTPEEMKNQPVLDFLEEYKQAVLAKHTQIAA